MAMFNIEETPLRSFGSLDFVSIVDIRGRCKAMAWVRVVRKNPNPNPDGRSS